MREKIHMIGIGGVGMGALAELLCEAGYRVSGSDEKLYPPMSDMIANLNIKVFEGYSPSNIRDKPDLVIIGNVVTKNNREVEEVFKLGVPYKSMPKAFADIFLEDKIPIVTAGTHGKTTSAALLAWVFKTAGEDPGFLIGGVARNFQKNAHIGKGPAFIVEGDEYDTAFFDKGPKFLHYRPKAVLLTSIEFDHADIYRDLAHIKESFRKLLCLLPPDGLLVGFGEDKNVQELKKEIKCRVVTYGLTSSCDYYAADVNETPDGMSFNLQGPRINALFKTPLFGGHNLANCVGVAALSIEYGLNPEKIGEAFASFEGVARRQEIKGNIKTVTVIDDFAHHPTAVSKTLIGARERYPARRIWAIFEPRSNTSRRNIFQTEFIEAFLKADKVIIGAIFKAEKIPEEERLDVSSIVSFLTHKGIDAHYIPKTEHILEYILRNIIPNDVVVIMSNGSFENLPGRLVEGLTRRRIL